MGLPEINDSEILHCGLAALALRSETQKKHFINLRKSAISPALGNLDKNPEQLGY